MINLYFVTHAMFFISLNGSTGGFMYKGVEAVVTIRYFLKNEYKNIRNNK